MTDETTFSEVEEMLRAAGPLETPPPNLHDAAREAALGTGDVVRLRPPTRMDGRLVRVLLAAAVLTASALTALVIGVGGNRLTVEHRISLSGASSAAGASAVIDVGAADGAVRPLVLHVSRLAPAPKGAYYELWMQTGAGDPTGMVAFNTDSGGGVVAQTTMPSDMGWSRCWVTLESADGHRSTVLRLAA